MDEKSANHWIEVLLASPALTFVAFSVMFVLFWRFFNWAYSLKISSLEEQVKTITARRDLAIDQLEAVNKELEIYKSKLDPKDAEAQKFSNLIFANTATISSSGGTIKPHITRVFSTK